MRRLMLLRHAKSNWSEPGLSDHDRPLNKRGQQSAPRLAAYIAHNGLTPDHILCSTAKRTRETCELILAGLPEEPPVAYEDALYAAAPNTILGLIRETPQKAHSLLVVGHNPGLQQAALLLIASGDVEMRERLREKFPTAGLAVIDIALDDWRKLHPQSGRLDRFVTPALLDTETD